MRKTILILLIGIFGVGLAGAQEKKSTGDNHSSVKALEDLESRWVAALAKSDTAALDAMLAQTYVDSDEHGQRSNKEQLLAALKSGDLKVESIKLLDMHVTPYGNAAVVTGKAEQKGSVKGQSVSGTIIFTDTFVKENGKWKAVASHRSSAS